MRFTTGGIHRRGLETRHLLAGVVVEILALGLMRELRHVRDVLVLIAVGGGDTDSERPNGTIQGTITAQGGLPIADAWVAGHQSLEDQPTTRSMLVT